MLIEKVYLLNPYCSSLLILLPFLLWGGEGWYNILTNFYDPLVLILIYCILLLLLFSIMRILLLILPIRIMVLLGIIMWLWIIRMLLLRHPCCYPIHPHHRLVIRNERLFCILIIIIQTLLLLLHLIHHHRQYQSLKSLFMIHHVI